MAFKTVMFVLADERDFVTILSTWFFLLKKFHWIDILIIKLLFFSTFWYLLEKYGNQFINEIVIHYSNKLF